MRAILVGLYDWSQQRLHLRSIAQQSGPYKVIKAAKVGGEGGWDYINADVSRAAAVYSARCDPGSPGHGYDTCDSGW